MNKDNCQQSFWFQIARNKSFLKRTLSISAISLLVSSGCSTNQTNPDIVEYLDPQESVVTQKQDTPLDSLNTAAVLPTSNSNNNQHSNTNDLPEGITQNWFTQAQNYIRESEYHIKPHTPSSKSNTRHLNLFQAPNRAHNLRTYFDDDGIRVVPRTGTQDWEWGLTLKGYGSKENIQPVTQATKVTDGNRIEYQRGNITEWYINNSEGLEQGFTILKAPNKDANNIVVEIAIEGDLKARLHNNNIAFYHPEQGHKLNYNKLIVYDINNNHLQAQFKLNNDTLYISVDTTNAIYPIIIDPIVTGGFETQIESNGNGNFASLPSHSIGDVNGDGFHDIAISALSGSVYLFYGSENGITSSSDWNINEINEDALLTAGQFQARFGWSISSCDINNDNYNDVIVGAPLFDNTIQDEGAIFIYYGSATGITSGSPSVADHAIYSTISNSNFGDKVDCGNINDDSFNDIITSSEDFTNPEFEEGAAFIFHGTVNGITANTLYDANTWIESNINDSKFGHDISIAGDINGDGIDDLIISAHKYTIVAREGAVFAFHGTNLGIIAADISDADTTIYGGIGDELGQSISSAGDVNYDGYSDIIIGTTENVIYDDAGHYGAAFVFHGATTGIAASLYSDADAILFSPVNEIYSNFGASVDQLGDINGDGFDDVIVLAEYYDNNETDEGTAFIYLGGQNGITDTILPTSSTIDATLDHNFEAIGLSIAAAAGDVNNDGYADVIIGSSGYSNNPNNEGMIRVYHGKANTIRNTDNNDPTLLYEHTSIESNIINGQLGASLVNIGDVFGDDGIPDIATSIQNYGPGGESAVLFYKGRHDSASIIETPVKVIQASVVSDFGSSIASAGDLNADGYNDLLVGDISYSNMQTNEGAVYIFYGDATGYSATSELDADTVLESNYADSYFGSTLANAGDINADGFSDIIIGAYGTSSVNEGKVFIIHGSASHITSSDPSSTLHENITTIIDSAQNYGQFGYSVDTAGDVNNDGYDDIIIGAPSYEIDDGNTNNYGEGVAFIFHGSTSGINVPSVGEDIPYANSILQPNYIGSNFGTSVAGAGDVDGDGYDDVIIGAPLYADNLSEGAAFIFYGNNNGITSSDDINPYSTMAGTILQSNQSLANFGRRVGSAGDLNLDGYKDIYVGATQYDDNQTDEGAIFLFNGQKNRIPSTASTDGSPINANSILQFNNNGENIGEEIATGDFNLDGYSDVVVGRTSYSNGETSEGAIYAFLGNYQHGNYTAPTNVSDTTHRVLDNINVKVHGYSPKLISGVGKSKRILEVCKHDALFGDTSCLTTTSIGDTSYPDGWIPNTISTTLTINNLPEDIYKWRARSEAHPDYAPVGSYYSPWFYNDGGSKKNKFRYIIDGDDNGESDLINPIITNTPINLLEPNTLYSFTPIVTDLNFRETFTFSIINKPSWASFDTPNCSKGELCGTPTNNDYGNYHNIKITVTDSDGLSDDTGDFTISVIDNTSPEITSNITNDGLGNIIITLTCTDSISGCSGPIYYTLDGSPPSSSSTEYTGPILVSEDTEVLIYTEDASGNTTTVAAESITITNPTEFYIGVLPIIDGTIIDMTATLTSVELQIYGDNNTVLIESNGTLAFVPLPGFQSLPATVDLINDTWNYTANIPYANDVEYTIYVTATDDSGNRSTSSRTFTYYSGAPAATSLQLSLTSNAILNNGEIDATLTLTNLGDPNDDLTGIPVILHVTDPDSVTTSINTTTNISGNAVFSQLGDGSNGITFDNPGPWTLEAEFDNAAYPNLAAAMSTPQTLLVNTSAGYAIIVQGKLPGTSDITGVSSHNKTANRIYQTFKDRGLVDDDIFYYNFDTLQVGVDGVPSKAVIQGAIENLASDIQSRPAPIYVVMVDHGGKANVSLDTHFFLDTEVIEPDELNLWLSTLESNMDALDTQLALDNPRIVIIGACYSGGFIPELSAANRIIISSATENEQSFKGPVEDDNVRVGEYFLEELFLELGAGNNLNEAFKIATTKTETYTKELSGDIGLNSGDAFLDTAIQHPLLDDNGDTDGTNDLYDNTDDGQLAETIVLGITPDSIANDAFIPAAVTTVSPTQYLINGDDVADLELFANDIYQVNEAYVEVRSPSQVLAVQPDTVTEQQTSDYDRRAFTPPAVQGGAYTLSYDMFTTPGKYELYHYVNDRYTFELSPAVRSLVYKDSATNTDYPTAFDLVSPSNNATLNNSVIGFDWQDATDADGLTYTLMIADDNTFTSFTHLDENGACNEVSGVYVQEELTSSSTYIDATAGLCDYAANDGYYWKVIAVDSFGRTTPSTSTFFFDTDGSGNASAVMVTTVKSIQTNQLLIASNVAGDQVVNNYGEQASASILYQGQLVILTSNPGVSQTVTAQIPGYQDVQVFVSGSTIAAGQTAELLFNMPTDIVDTDGDGMSDDYENANGLNPLVDDAALDLDGDGISNIQEHDNGTAPNNIDSDSDGQHDGIDPNPLVANAIIYGDVAPSPLSDGMVNGADLLIMQRIILGDITPNVTQLINGDMYPVGAPNGVINIQDMILLNQMVVP